VPAECSPGEYGIGVGLWDPATGRRFDLLGNDDGTTRYMLGTLVVEGTADRISGVRLVRADAASGESPSWNIERVPVDFGPTVTEGAFRCRKTDGALAITPLPDLGPFSITLRPRAFGESATVQSVIAVDAAGTRSRNLDFTRTGDTLQFRTQRGEFGYRIDFGQQREQNE